MLIIITGEIGSGKTTVCRKLAALARCRGYSCGGILTNKEMDGGMAVLDIASGRTEALASLRPVYDGPSTPKYHFSKAGIRFGNEAIRRGLDRDVLLVDELGKLELSGNGFAYAVSMLSRGRKGYTVLVIRQELLHYYPELLKQGPRVFEVNRENRDALPPKILAEITKAGKRLPQHFVSAIVLAAGESKRLSGNKLLRSLGKKSILETTVDNVLGSLVNEVIVVLGHRAEETRTLVQELPVQIIENPDYREGMSASIIKGLDAASPRASGIMLVLADQPLISPEIFNRLLDEFARLGKGIMAPVCRGRRGHPVIFGKDYFAEIRQLRGDIGGREIMKRHPGQVREVETGDESILADIDTTANYEAMCIIAGQGQ